MTKADLIDAVHAAGHTNSKKDAANLIQATMDALSEGITQGRFSYPGFGTWNVRQRAARQGRNPRTGEAITIPASKTVSFKAAPALKGNL